MGFRDCCHVNKRLIPYKLHFFFVFGGFSAVLPFMPLLAKQLGINATALGVGYSMIPIFVFLSNPISGLLVDYFKNIKLFLILLLVTSSVSYFSVLFIPPIESEADSEAYVRIATFNETEHPINLPTPFHRTCLELLLGSDIDCKLILNENTSCEKSPYTRSFLDVSYNDSSSYNDTYSENVSKLTSDKYWITFTTKESTFFDKTCITNLTTAFQCIPTIYPCLYHEEYTTVYSTYQFWTFMTLAVIGGITGLSTVTLSTAACIETLGKQIEAYGNQRLFGTISCGLICTLAGILNDIPKSTGRSFAPGFYLMVAFVVVDVIILCAIQIPKTHISSHMCSDLGKIFRSMKILTFSFGVTVCGSLNSLITGYEFWYLEDMGASRTLLGLTVAMQCLIGEVPFLYFSGWIVRKLGHFLCFVCVFGGYAVRLGLYSIIKDPWLVLPIDILHGVTFAIYYGAMASFAKEQAPKGLETTLLGWFIGLYYGLGNSVGSFLGGVGLDNLGPRRTFSSASMLSTGNLLLFLIATYCFRSRTVTKQTQETPSTAKDTFDVEWTKLERDTDTMS